MASRPTIQVITAKLHAHKQTQFTGILYVSVGKNTYWAMYFHMGRLVWAYAHTHSLRRWHRQLLKYYPHLVNEALARKNSATGPAGQPDIDPYAALHYSKLIPKVREGKLNRLSLANAIEEYLSEILFDIVHQGTLRQLHSKAPFTWTDIPKRFSSQHFLMVRTEQTWQQTQHDWQAWQQAKLIQCSPNLAPVIGQAADLQKRTSAAIYQYFVSIIDGKQTFRDIAVRTEQSLLTVTKQIEPHVRQGLIGLVRVGDLGARPARKPVQPISQTASAYEKSQLKIKTAELRTSTPTTQATNNAPLIIYIDDSPGDSRKMGEILQAAGFRFLNIQESTHALPLLIEHKPQLIFLDLVMPVANGYEICSQVRRISLFCDTPIIIVTSNNSLADRVKAKIVGASGFLSKPIERTKTLNMVQKFFDPKVHALDHTTRLTQAEITPILRRRFITQTNLSKAQSKLTIQSLKKKQAARKNPEKISQ